MAVLSDSDRGAVTNDLMADYSANRTSLGNVAKVDIRAAINAIDQFLSDNAAALNSAIPQPARGQLTAEQKARLLVFVIRRRWIAGS